jgi:hypothetical protein
VGSTKGRLARALRIVQSLHNRVQQDGHVIKQLTREVQELRDTIKRRDEEVARVTSPLLCFAFQMFLLPLATEMLFVVFMPAHCQFPVSGAVPDASK